MGENKQLTLMSHTWLPFIVDDVNGVGGGGGWYWV